MDVVEIIKDALVFPSENIGQLLIYEILAILAAGLSIIGTIVYILGFIKPECFMWGGLAGVVALVLAWILSGYLLSVVKSGIEHDDKVPQFEWWDNFIIGFDNFIVSIVYFIIPAFIVFVVGYATNIYGNIMVVAHGISAQAQAAYAGTSTVIVLDPIAQALANLVVSLSLTITLAIILFIIFSFLQTMAEARLANTGSLSEALNVLEAAKDIKRIGVAKVVAVILLVIIVAAIIGMILSAIYAIMPILSILSIIVTPYMIFFAQRAIGLLYSDIA